eukprot:contig_41299_g9411
MTEALRKKTSTRRWQDLHALKGDHPCLSSPTVAPHCGVAGGATRAVAAVASPTGPPVTISAFAALTALRADLLAFPAAVTRGAVMGAVADGAVRELSTLAVAHSILSYAVVLGVLRPTDDHDLHETIYERVYFGVVRRLAPDEMPISLAAVRAARRRSDLRPSAALTLSSSLRYAQLVQADLLAVCHRLSCVEGDAPVLLAGGHALLEDLRCLRQQLREKERRQRQAAVVSTAFKVGLDPLPLVGKFLGAGIDAATAVLEMGMEGIGAPAAAVTAFIGDCTDLGAAGTVLGSAARELSPSKGATSSVDFGLEDACTLGELAVELNAVGQQYEEQEQPAVEATPGRD